MSQPKTDYFQDVARFLARTGALFFDRGLRLKDGRPTPYFVNLGRVNTGRAGLALAGFFARMLHDEGLIDEETVIIGPSYKGPPLAALTAAALYIEYGLSVGYDYDRKEAKTHGEASGAKSMFVTGALAEARKAVIIDDVATSMATKIELIDKIKRVAPTLGITAVVIAVDREQTQPVYDESGKLVEGVKGKDAVRTFTEKTGVPVLALAPITRVVEYLYRERLPVKVRGEMKALSRADKDAFDAYLALYGRH